MNESFYDEEPPSEVPDRRVIEARPKIVAVLKNVRVATDRELKVRLEKQYFPWVVGRALGQLFDEDIVSKVSYPGRRRVKGSEVGAFYTLKETEYESVRETVKKKKVASEAIANVLTGVSPVADHAEDLFEQAFRDLGFTFCGRDVSEFRGHRAVGVPGKEPPNVDFVFERDRVAYGIDVKNWIR